MAKVTVWKSKFVKGWNGGDPTGVDLHPVHDLEFALGSTFDSDAHFVPYYIVTPQGVEQMIPRVNKQAVPSELFELRFDVLVYDVDCPEAHQSGGAASEEWRQEHRNLRDQLPWSDTMGWYETRGGYRMLWMLEESVGPDEYIHKLNSFRVELGKHGIDCDPLIDWTRCYRLPNVLRDGELQTWPQDFSLLGILEYDYPEPSGGVFSGISSIRQTLTVPDQIESGGRNTMLTRVAGSFRRNGLEYQEILNALEVVNASRCNPPMGMADLEQIARSVCRYDPAPEVSEAREDGDNTAAGTGPRFMLGSEVEFADAVCEELESKEKMVFDREKLWRYAPEKGVWQEMKPVMVYNTMARFDGEPVVIGREADGTPRTRPLKVSNRLTEDVCKLVWKRRTHTGFFDNSAHGVAFENGFMRVADGKVGIEPFSPDHRGLHGLPFVYEKGKVPKMFVGMLQGCFRDDPDCIEKVELVRQFIGVCLLGMATRYQKGMMLVGDGANGKSTFQAVVSALFKGEGMVTAVPPQEMEQEYRRAMLSKSLLNVVNELPEADILSSEAVKAMISGDLVVGRYIRQAPFEFKPRAGHLFSANNLPGVRDMSRGFWRRWLVVEFNREFQEREQDRFLAARIIRDELSMIASWAMDGAESVIQSGKYVEVRSSEDAVNQWRMQADQVAMFMEQKTDLASEKDWTPAEKFYVSYCQWAKVNNHYALSATKFGKRLHVLGVNKKRNKNGISYNVKMKQQLFAVK